MSNQQVAALCACGVIVSCTSEPPIDPGRTSSQESTVVTNVPARELLPDLIVAERGGFIPEGVEYDMANERLLTGSLSEGSVYQIHEDGRVTEIVADAELVSSVGIEADETRNRLLVANADRSVFESGGIGQAKLGAYNLTTGERIAMVDLAATIGDIPEGAAHFANDVAVADNGTAYVTDTRMNVIYEVTIDYEASVLHRFNDDGAGPNGIVHHPDGYLLIARGATLWKVPTNDPGRAAEVLLPEPVTGQDGMVWSAMRLVIVSNDANRVVALTSQDNWVSAEVVAVGPYETQATTAAVVGDEIYVVHPHFGDEDPPSVERVELQ